MLEASRAYEEAVAAGKRHIVPLAVVDLVDPDIAYGPVMSNGAMSHSDPKQLYDKRLKAEGPKYGSLELNRWVLDGSFEAMPEDPEEMTGEHGYLVNRMSRQDGSFEADPYVELRLRNLGIMQAAAVYFTGRECDGCGADFLFEVYSGENSVFTKSVTGNREPAVFFEGFTVHDVTALRITLIKWSMPYRYPRICELLPGIYEKWDENELYQIDVLHETAFDCLTVPYGSCTIEVWNRNKRFNPFAKSSLFQSIEARQGIPVSYGVRLPDGSFEYLPLGVYYQQNGGWETDAYGLTISFKLVDIIGLLTNRDYMIPDPLPATLSEWIESIVAHLGENFRGRFEVAASIANLPITATAEQVPNLNCGQILRYACMAAGAFYRADAATGRLKVEPLPAAGGVNIELNNMHRYPQNQAGDNVAQITFRLADAEKTGYTVNGTLEAADKSINISNPFLRTEEQADAAAGYILQFYGTTKFTLQGRGDMRCELGDVDIFETGFEGTATGRRYKQQFKIENGIMKTAPSYLMADGNIVG